MGGIQELCEIAAMAEAYHVVVSPHNDNSVTVGLAATPHVSAAIPNFLITEYFVNFEHRIIEARFERPAPQALVEPERAGIRPRDLSIDI